MKNKMRLIIFITFFANLCCNVVLAQEIKKITLQDAIEVSIKNSKNLKLFNAKIDEATAVVKEAYNNQLPDFKVSGSYLRLSSANVDLKDRKSVV